MISPVLITLFFASFAEAIESKKQTFLRPLTSYPSLKESSAQASCSSHPQCGPGQVCKQGVCRAPSACGRECDLKKKHICKVVEGKPICTHVKVEVRKIERLDLKTYIIDLSPEKDVLDVFGKTSFSRTDDYNKKGLTVVRKKNRELFCNGEEINSVVVANKKDLLKIFDFGNRDDIRRVFTFVINDQGMYAVETVFEEETIECLSKHIILANGALETRMAGTFRFVHTGDEHIMVLDNDSGTYMPTFAGLQNTKKLLEAKFPELRIEVLDRMEKQPEHTKKWVGPLELPEMADDVEEIPDEILYRIDDFEAEFGENFTIAYKGKGWEWTPSLDL